MKKYCYVILMGEMLPVETKQSGGKILPHLDLRGGVFLEEASRNRKRKRDIMLGTCRTG
jgi:hypothetical protein